MLCIGTDAPLRKYIRIFAQPANGCLGYARLNAGCSAATVQAEVADWLCKRPLGLTDQPPPSEVGPFRGS